MSVIHKRELFAAPSPGQLARVSSVSSPHDADAMDILPRQPHKVALTVLTAMFSASRARLARGALVVAGAIFALMAAAPIGQAGELVVGEHGWVWPLDPDPSVVHRFNPPQTRWSPGHRGVDLAGAVGQPVLAIGAGTVSYAGVLAGRGVVVVVHGVLRSTYEPVTASVQVGDKVTAGQAIGLLQAVGSHCAPASCLHLGLRRGALYLDPLSLLGPRPVRLKPLSSGDMVGLTSGRPPAADSSTPVAAASAAAPDSRDRRFVDRRGPPSSRVVLMLGGAIAAVGAVTMTRLLPRSQARG